MGNTSLLTCTSRNYRVQDRQDSATPHLVSTTGIWREGNFSQVYVNHTVEIIFCAVKSYNAVAVDRFRRIAEDFRNGRRGGPGHSPKFLVGLSEPRNPISDQNL